MIDSSKYRISVQRRDTEDGLLFEGTVHELPDVETYGDTFGEAYELAIDAIEGLYRLATKQDRSFPKPSIRETEYSGKFVIRMPKWLHRDLAVEAADEGVSLNLYAVSALSAHKVRGTAVIQHTTIPNVSILPGVTYVSSGSPLEIIGFGEFLPEFDVSDDIGLAPFVKEGRSASDWFIASPSRRISNET